VASVLRDTSLVNSVAGASRIPIPLASASVRGRVAQTSAYIY